MNDIYEDELEDAEIDYIVLEGSTESDVFIMVRKILDHWLVLYIYMQGKSVLLHLPGGGPDGPALQGGRMAGL